MAITQAAINRDPVLGGGAGGPLASATRVAITGTTAQTILAFTPLTDTNLWVGGYFRVAGAATTVAVAVSYTDGAGSQTLSLLPVTSEAVDSYALQPALIEVAGGQPVTVTVTAGTANQVEASASLLQG